MNGRRLWVMVLLIGALMTPRACGQLTPDQRRRIDAAAPDKARATPTRPRRVLIWNTPFMEDCPHKGYCVPQGAYAMGRLGEKTGAFEPVVSDDVALFLPESLGRFDAIVMNNSNGPWIRPQETDLPRLGRFASVDEAEQALRKSFMDWVRGGHGVVAYHHAIAGNPKWTEFTEMLGAAYWGHPWNEEVAIRVEEPNHPLMTAFEGRDFRLADEIFQFREPYSRRSLRVLLSLDTANTNMTVPWIHRTDGDFGLAWVRPWGRGRVFYCAIGHRTEIWWNPRVLRFYLDAIQYACGDLAADNGPPGR